MDRSHASPAQAGERPAPLAPGAPTHKTLGLALTALGIVYGDIGTSPLYAVKECFHGMHAIELNEANVFGVLALIFWSLTVVVSIKYVMFIMRADNHGEGGIFALLALFRSVDKRTSRARAAIITLGIFGAALLYGDGIITPAISVLSAVEGLGVATEAASPFVVPITCVILLGLFLVQHHGTESIGTIFGWIMIVWFLAIGGLGLIHILDRPNILLALNPVYAYRFFAANHLHGVVVLGSVVLCITGGEALYADMGHFGRRPIRLSWYGMVFPALVMNYFGQGALLLQEPDKASNPFFGLVPEALLYPTVLLATAATVIASQAMISGVYSLTQQAVQLGYFPRIRIVHTSEETKGQIYLPGINKGMMIACIGLVLAFQESSRLAAAYGIAVTATMAITSLLYAFVLRENWRWPMWKVVPLVGLFLVFDTSYLGANLLKFVDGGWFTITVALAVMVCMTTWRDGRAELARRMSGARLPISVFLDDIARHKPYRVPGTAVFMSVSAEGTPIPLLHHVKHNKVIHEQVVLLSITGVESPQVDPAERLNVTRLGQGFYRLLACYGFMETPNVPEIAALANEAGVPMNMASTTFYLGRETLLDTGRSPMASWRKALFTFMSRNSWNATTFFGIPPGRVVELGSQVEL